MVLSRYAGAEVRRKEDPRLITGSSTYVDDIRLPGTLHVAVVRSPYGHATITGIDAAAALALPGVVAVFTGEDLKAFCGPLEGGGGEGGTSGEGSSGEQGDPDEGAEDEIPTPATWAVAVDRVRFVGEPVAVVVAEDRYVAEDAREAVEVSYDALPTVAHLDDARADGAPLLYDEIPNNLGMRWDRVHGDVEAAFRDAPVTASARIRSQRLAGVPMEPRGILAAPDPITRGLTVWTSTQAPHWNRNDIAEALGLSQTQVRAIAPEVGGGFGVKIGSYQEDFICAALAHRLGKPVKWIETRSENFLATHHGRDQWADVEVAADADGRLRGVRMNVAQDLGAYAKGTDLPELTGRLSAGCYDIPALEFHATGYYTNTMAVGAYRGAGRPEAAYYIERVIDLVADAAGVDPAEVRRINFIPPDQFPHTTAAGEIYDTGEYEKALDKALEVSGYADLRREQAEGRANGRYLGIGLASYVEICGFGPYESSTVRVEPSGAVSIFTGISPHGQGHETTFAQLAADHLGADFDQVFVHHGDTSNTPQGNGTMGSRGLAVGGGALMLSLKKVQEKARRVAAHLLEAAVEDVELHDGKYRVRGVPEGGMSLAQVAEAVYDDVDDMPRDIEAGLQSTDYFRPEDETFPFGTHVALVEVSAETGEVEILRYVSVDDCGVIVSPLLVTGQVHGGLAQGIGQALFEEIRYDATGELVTGTLNDYTIARARYLPRFETHHTETPTPINLIGAKGIGEAATIGSTPAMANAVIDALEPFGITHLDVPMTPERIWQAMRSSGAAATEGGRAAD
ncbi:MAG: Aerobic carbon monoxide dehydrogenase (quinone), large chain [uncultured Thermomicrobiales bacterium]|uniref:Aerobic carbon monoxide dehydrogenase (Quinone), large chain n=1 Tax=uncultured Thermomicrobiales bacterium TaxID=1645740 RepID=A0A6J4UJ24_9BACT|nr:MAG: Aerobic carbon monoxide dehydrogenase (quinone), large chain [uncultured Thermomicrobiales bacterium]